MCYLSIKFWFHSSEVLTTLTTDVNKLMSKLLAIQPQGEVKLMSGLRVAHLALKHRQVSQLVVDVPFQSSTDL